MVFDCTSSSNLTTRFICSINRRSLRRRRFHGDLHRKSARNAFTVYKESGRFFRSIHGGRRPESLLLVSFSIRFQRVTWTLSTYTPVHFHDGVAIETVAAFVAKMRGREKSSVDLEEGEEEQEGSARAPVEKTTVKKNHAIMKHDIIAANQGLQGQYRGFRLTSNIYACLFGGKLDNIAAWCSVS